MIVAQPLLQKLCGITARCTNFESVLAAIKQDIQGLLNSFAAPLHWSHAYPHLDRSVLNFGLPNYLTTRYTSLSQLNQLCVSVKQQIIINEPRLFDVTVSMYNDDDYDSGLVFQLKINAKLLWQQRERSVVLESDWNPLNMSFTLL